MQPDAAALVYEHDELAELDPAGRRLALRDIFTAAGVVDIAGCVARVADEIDGLGPVSDLMMDPAITDILINGPREVWVERGGVMHRTDRTFDSAEHLTTWSERLISLAGGRIDTSHPIADARLGDGSRVHVVLPPVAPGGPLVSLRKFPDHALTLADLRAGGSLTVAEAELLGTSVRQGCSIVISGATGSGKTTLLGALLQLVPQTERVVIIEELPELKALNANQVSLVGRTANAEGKGAVGLEELVRASLRMRPDRIVIGEVRGAEALPALWATRTGHAGTMLSIHAASAADAARRLVDLALMSERAATEETLVRTVEAAVDVRVHMVRRNGRRVIEEIVTSK